MLKSIITIALLLANVAMAQFNADSSSFIDKRDGKTYKTVKINGAVWMAENLDYKGSSKEKEIGVEMNLPKYRKNKQGGIDTSMFKYGQGRAYDWHEALKVCPAEWKLPDGEEWQTLGTNLRKMNIVPGSGYPHYTGKHVGLFWTPNDKYLASPEYIRIDNGELEVWSNLDRQYELGVRCLFLPSGVQLKAPEYKGPQPGDTWEADYPGGSPASVKRTKEKMYIKR